MLRSFVMISITLSVTSSSSQHTVAVILNHVSQLCVLNRLIHKLVVKAMTKPDIEKKLIAECIRVLLDALFELVAHPENSLIEIRNIYMNI